MNSLRYLVSSAEDGKQKNESEKPIKSLLKESKTTNSLLWRLIYKILPFLQPQISQPTSTLKYNPEFKFGSESSGGASSSVVFVNSTKGDAHGDASPATKHRRRKSSTSTSLPSIPRLLDRAKRKTLVLDLDETLIHSMTRGHNTSASMVEVHLRNTPVSSFYYVSKRPYCSEFLQSVLQWYELCIFTASVQEYADPIVDMLEHDLGRPCFQRRFYRDSCKPVGSGSYVKDLRVLNEDLSHVLLVDNSPVSFQLQEENGLPIDGWISDPSDRCLLQLLPLLYALRHTSDVRSILCLKLGPKAEPEIKSD